MDYKIRVAIMVYECEEIIVKLTTGNEFEKYLTSIGLKKEDEKFIQNQLLNDFYMDYVDKDGVETRLNEIINQLLIDREITDESVNDLNDDEKYLTYLYNQNHTITYCSNCRSKILYNDSYCYKCGVKTDYKSPSVIGYNVRNKHEKSIEKNKIVDDSKIPSQVALLYASYIVLEYIKNNPVISKIPKEILRKYDIDENTVYNYILNEKLINISDNNNSFYLRLSKLSEEELKELLLKYNLEVQDTKVNMISSLIHNINHDELDLILKHKVYLVTKKGKQLIEDNPQIFFYNKFLKDYSFEVYNQLYIENKGVLNISKIGRLFLQRIRENSIKTYKWGTYRNTFLSNYEIAKFTHDKKMITNSLLSLYICDISSWSNNKFLVDGIVIVPYIKKLLIDNLKDEYYKDEEAFKKQFLDICKNIDFPSFMIPPKALYVYLIRILHDEPIRTIKKEVKTKIHLDMNADYYFDNEFDQDRVSEMIKDTYY